MVPTRNLSFSCVHTGCKRYPCPSLCYTRLKLCNTDRSVQFKIWYNHPPLPIKLPSFPVVPKLYRKFIMSVRVTYFHHSTYISVNMASFRDNFEGLQLKHRSEPHHFQISRDVDQIFTYTLLLHKY